MRRNAFLWKLEEKLNEYRGETQTLSPEEAAGHPARKLSSDELHELLGNIFTDVVTWFEEVEHAEDELLWHAKDVALQKGMFNQVPLELREDEADILLAVLEDNVDIILNNSHHWDDVEEYANALKVAMNLKETVEHQVTTWYNVQAERYRREKEGDK